MGLAWATLVLVSIGAAANIVNLYLMWRRR